MTKISDTKRKELEVNDYFLQITSQIFVNNEKKIKINIKIQVGSETFLSVLINLIIDLLK